jgi:hypothetical protein
MEAHSSYRAPDWTPQRLMFHQNLESFAERVGLLVGLWGCPGFVDRSIGVTP